MTQLPATPTTPTNYPGRTLGIIGFVLAFLVSLPGIIVSAVALHESRSAGQKNPFAVAGLAVSITLTVLSILSVILAFVILAMVWNTCSTLGNGVHILENGATITCSMNLLG